MKKLDLSQIIDNLSAISENEFKNISNDIKDYLKLIGSFCQKRKGLYTVLVTLLYYKYLNPEQDIRYHQAKLKGGFSARSFDTANVTPILAEKGFPAMAESGWLTRSMEYAEPYDFNYSGEIQKTIKKPFLTCLDYVEKNSNNALPMLKILLLSVKDTVSANKVEIIPLQNPDGLTITSIVSALEEHFLFKYGTHNGAKLPVLAFYSIYLSLISEVKRYENCKLKPLSSLTASDRTNKSAGDIEIFNRDKIFETIEIKLDKQIDKQIMQVVKNKVIKWNPQRYYVLSVKGIKEEDNEEIISIVKDIELKHGCQIIINGLIQTIKYYLRLIINLKDFTNKYSELVDSDTELQVEHKKKWNELITKYNL